MRGRRSGDGSGAGTRSWRPRWWRQLAGARGRGAAATGWRRRRRQGVAAGTAGLEGERARERRGQLTQRACWGGGTVSTIWAGWAGGTVSTSWAGWAGGLLGRRFFCHACLIIQSSGVKWLTISSQLCKVKCFFCSD